MADAALAKAKVVTVYEGDRITLENRNTDFINEPRFAEAYAKGTALHPNRMHHRVDTVLWAASVGLHLEGDFVECGVHLGVYSKAVFEYHRFAEQTGRKFYLCDTYAGLDPSLITAAELAKGRTFEDTNKKIYPKDFYEITRERFAEYPNAVMVRGSVPGTLSQVKAEKVAYLSIDMNCVAPEIAAGEYFWPIMSAGAMIVLDDYGFRGYGPQHKAWNRFAEERGVQILHSPSGQGVMVKPP